MVLVRDILCSKILELFSVFNLRVIGGLINFSLAIDRKIFGIGWKLLLLLFLFGTNNFSKLYDMISHHV